MNACILVIIYCVGLVLDVSNLATWGICYVLLCLVVLYLPIFMELLILLLAYIVIQFSIWISPSSIL